MPARPCPLCQSVENESVIDLEADEFCRTNGTYAASYRTMLGLTTPAIFSLVRCRYCAFTFSGTVPEPEFLTTLYDQVIRRESCIEGSENASGYARRLRYVAELLELAPSSQSFRALDFGSGLGVTTRILVACRVDSVGVDPSALRADYVTKAGITTFHSLASAAPHGPFSMLILDNVLEHLPSPRETITELSALMSKGAIAYVSVPSYEPERLTLEIAKRDAGHEIDMTLNPWEHLSYFSLLHLDQLMQFGGFLRLIARQRRHEPSVGLRAEAKPIPRIKNAAASSLRLAQWMITGSVSETTEHAFYRKT